jgi:hypothetical protein
MNSKALWWSVLVVGVALIVAPLAMGPPGKSAAGERMMGDFQPIMTAAHVQKTADYYYKVFVPLGNVAPAMSGPNVKKFAGYANGFGGMQTDAAKLVPMLAAALHMTPAQVQAMMGTQLPAMTALLQGLPQMKTDFASLIGLMQANVGIFAQVPAGLTYYKPLVDTMQGNVSDFSKINSLPNFNLFTWFFVLPGLLLVLLSGAGLWSAGALHVHLPRPHPAA